MLWGCGGKDLSAWRPSSFMGLREQQSWMGLGRDGELENEGNGGISHIFLSARTSRIKPVLQWRAVWPEGGRGDRKTARNCRWKHLRTLLVCSIHPFPLPTSLVPEGPSPCIFSTRGSLSLHLQYPRVPLPVSLVPKDPSLCISGTRGSLSPHLWYPRVPLPDLTVPSQRDLAAGRLKVIRGHRRVGQTLAQAA